jgi:hypothetical protein
MVSASETRFRLPRHSRNAFAAQNLCFSIQNLYKSMVAASETRFRLPRHSRTLVRSGFDARGWSDVSPCRRPGECFRDQSSIRMPLGHCNAAMPQCRNATMPQCRNAALLHCRNQGSVQRAESPKIAAEKAEYVKKPKELNETIPIYGIVSLGRLIATFNNCMSVAQLVAFLEHFLYIQLWQRRRWKWWRLERESWACRRVSCNILRPPLYITQCPICLILTHHMQSLLLGLELSIQCRITGYTQLAEQDIYAKIRNNMISQFWTPLTFLVII